MHLLVDRSTAPVAMLPNTSCGSCKGSAEYYNCPCMVKLHLVSAGWVSRSLHLKFLYAVFLRVPTRAMHRSLDELLHTPNRQPHMFLHVLLIQTPPYCAPMRCRATVQMLELLHSTCHKAMPLLGPFYRGSASCLLTTASWKFTAASCG